MHIQKPQKQQKIKCIYRRQHCVWAWGLEELLRVPLKSKVLNTSNQSFELRSLQHKQKNRLTSWKAKRVNKRKVKTPKDAIPKLNITIPLVFVLPRSHCLPCKGIELMWKIVAKKFSQPWDDDNLACYED